MTLLKSHFSYFWNFHYTFDLQEKILLDPMFDVPGSNIRSVYIDEGVVTGDSKAEYVTGPAEDSELHGDDSSTMYSVEENETRTTA